MTRLDVRDWLQAHQCLPEVEETINSTAYAVKFVNQSNGRHAYVNTPLNSRLVRPATVKQICLQLGIPLPEYALRED